MVALRPDAQALIERFRLNAMAGGTAFPVYRSDDGSVELVISGPGRINAAAATGYLAGLAHSESDVSGWINFGIAGSGQCDFGKVFLGNRISTEEAGQAWYPVAVWNRKRDLERREIHTVDAPTNDYPDGGGLVEMEAAGFYGIASRAASSEFCQVLKVVSDDPEHHMDAIDKPMVTRLCHEALDQAEDWLGAFREILVEENEKTADSDAFEHLVSELRFSVTQQHQLRRLLQQLQALGYRESVEPSTWKDGRACLGALKGELASLRQQVGDGGGEFPPC